MFNITHIKYTKSQLIDAINDYAENVSDEIIENVIKNLNYVIPNDITDKELHSRVSDYHGITVSELISSPNMTKLMEMWSIEMFNIAYNKLIELGLDDITSTAILYFAAAGTE